LANHPEKHIQRKLLNFNSQTLFKIEENWNSASLKQMHQCKWEHKDNDDFCLIAKWKLHSFYLTFPSYSDMVL